MSASDQRYDRMEFPWRLFIGVVSFFATIVLSYWGYRTFQYQKLLDEGLMAQCTIIYTSTKRYPEWNDGNVVFRIEAKDEVFEQYADVRMNDEKTVLIAPNGLPLKVGDGFMVRYLPDNPKNHEVLFDQPSDETLERYLRLAAMVQQRYMTRSTQGLYDLQCARCMVERLYEVYGLEALANIRYHDTSLLLNFSNNSWRHSNMVRSDEYSLIWKECDLRISNVEYSRGRIPVNL